MLNAIIFGASKTGEKVYNLMRYFYNVHAFCDNDESKWGSSHCGLPVISPQKINIYLEKINGCVVIASVFYYSIAAQLRLMGIQNFIIYKNNRFYNADMLKDEIDEVSNFFALRENIPLKLNCKTKLSVLLPTKNYNISNCLTHLKQISQYIDLEIFILDSSDREHLEIDKNIIAASNDMKMKHIICPPDMDFYKKLIAGIKMVQTEYSIFLATDDYLFISGLAASLDYLEKHSEVDCVKGKTLYFTDGNLNQMISKAPLVSPWQISKIKRLNSYSVWMVDFLYCVARTQNFKKAFDILVNLEHYNEMDLYFKEHIYYIIFILCNRVEGILNFLSAKDTERTCHYTYMEPYKNEEYIRKNADYFQASFWDICKELKINSIEGNDISFVGTNLLLGLPWHLIG